MPFQEVPKKVDFSAQELEILKFWKESHAFEKMVDIHKGQPRVVVHRWTHHCQQPDGRAPRLGTHLQGPDAALPHHAGA